MLLTGHASAIQVAGVALPNMGEYTLKLTQESDAFSTLDEPVEQNVGTFKKWDADFTLEGTVPARSYGAVTCQGWTGVFLKEWGVDLEAKFEDVPASLEEWQLSGISGINWSVDSTKWEDSASKLIFLQALLSQQQRAQVLTPVLTGYGIYGEAGVDFKPTPREEKISIKGDGLFTVGAFFADLVGIILGYRTELLANSGVVPSVVQITKVGSGTGYLTKLSFKSDGKRLKITGTLGGYGVFTLG